ncbi:4-(cytidine 5'-diphospho)-2-C-methyl-D-erythritol kinase [Dinoroseobacter sp. PD6]|uniref:4-(cytidine 5'-diphospho)-2-C-methyl-D-erythritol kinase n=1 Tax=Dinoroseobacter sp. PD6 TaxID=3028384 RepID=UPI00237BFAAD|nr:4-(cytidine 5'-diphospho)-2-C-methyl-D-erythritol kinase [Dinoroseobacter sp. PD6]MDD9716750.1 4-(cytidine 5'-diphospho)-2-C-methyl-D-erythritol kinase [Dinoroseobacter sp. PD6]
MSPPTEGRAPGSRPIAGFAPAKINLTLHVTGQREDGYHLLDSLVVFADIGDRLVLDPDAALGLTVSGPRAAGVPTGPENLILKAAAHLGAARGAIHLEKHLPAAAGIGGGSSDAATALRVHAQAMGCALPDDGAALGADVPVCLRGQATRMSGIGEALTPVAGLPPLPAVLVNPGVDVPTPAVFRGLRQKENPPMPADLPGFATPTDCARWLATQRNDLEPPARAAAPVIDSVLAEIAGDPDCLLARMSGSGATCFGLFETPAQAQAAAETLSTRHPDWWVAPTLLR